MVKIQFTKAITILSIITSYTVSFAHSVKLYSSGGSFIDLFYMFSGLLASLVGIVLMERLQHDTKN